MRSWMVALNRNCGVPLLACPAVHSPIGETKAARLLVVAIATCCLLLATSPAGALDRVVIKREGVQSTIDGRVLVEAADGGLLVEAADGVLWAVQPEELIERSTVEGEFELLDRDALAAQLLRETPDGFRIHNTAHYVMCYNTSPAYVSWCGALFERLYRGFHAYWRNQGWELADPPAPLVVMVFDSKQSYARYARPELGDAVDAIIGYYSLRSNRVVMYDLTGIEAAGGRENIKATNALISRVLARPQAAQAVATVVHEATHQLAFNTGLQKRYADTPLWVSEGLAIYFETPDLKSQRGWRSIGAVHRSRLAQFRKYLRSRPGDSLKTLIQNDDRLRNHETAPDAYAEAWALNFYLLRHKEEQYLAYLRKLAEKKLLVYNDEETRLKEFTDALGELDELDRDFQRYLRTVR